MSTQVHPYRSYQQEWLLGACILLLVVLPIELMYVIGGGYLLAQLVLADTAARAEWRSVYRVTDTHFERYSPLGRVLRVPWVEVEYIERRRGRDTLWSTAGPIPLARQVEGREEMLSAVRARIAALRPPTSAEPFDLSSQIGSAELVVVRHPPAPWAWLTRGADAVRAQRNRVAFDRRGLYVTTLRWSAAMAWTDVEQVAQMPTGWRVRTREGSVIVLTTHRNAERLIEVVHEVLRAKTEGLTVPGAAGAAPTALSRARMDGESVPETAVSRVAGEER